MIIYKGEAKGLTFKRLLWVAFWELSKPVEPLEAVDFSRN